MFGSLIDARERERSVKRLLETKATTVVVNAQQVGPGSKPGTAIGREARCCSSALV